MRLFPPAQPDAGQRHDTQIDKTSIGIIAGLGAVTAGLALTSSQVGRLRLLPSGNKGIALLTKCLAYGTAAAVPFALQNRYVEQRIYAHSVRSQGIAVPGTVYVDRLSHFDGDNAIVLGGLTGIFIASRFKRSGSSTGWRRYAVAMSLGIAPPTIGFRICRAIKHNDNESAWHSASSDLVVRPISSDLELASPSDFVRSALDYAWSGLVPLATSEDPQDDTSNAGSAMAMMGLGGDSGRKSLGQGGKFQVNSGPGGTPIQLEILDDGPHLAVKKNDKDPEIQPQTNYGWYSENKIAELEQQIANMRTKRQLLAHEAEVVWAWLSQKEAEHLEKYPVTKKPEEGDPEPSDMATESSMWVQSLGQIHTNLWREASACDWIIADSQKRIAQEKSLAASGKVQWRSTCSEAASASPLKVTLGMLKENIKVHEFLRDSVDQALSSLAMGLADPFADLNQMAMHPIKHEMAPQKEIIKDIREHLEEQKRTADLMAKTLGKAAEEAERKAGRGD